MYAEITKTYSKNESSICEIVENKKEIFISFAVMPQNTKGCNFA
jgi:hypothetical protein